MSSVVDIHAEDVTLETIQAELMLHPLRLEERKEEGEVGCTPLIAAATSGNVALVKFLLSVGANIEARNEVLYCPI